MLFIASFIEWDWPYIPSQQHYLDWIAALKASGLIDIVVRLFPLQIPFEANPFEILGDLRHAPRNPRRIQQLVR